MGATTGEIDVGASYHDALQIGQAATRFRQDRDQFLAHLQGPGRVWIQSLPFSRLASRVFAAAPQRGGSREEGSVLGGLGAGLLGGSLLGGLGGDSDGGD